MPIVLPLVGAGGIGAAAGGLVVLLQDYGKGYLSDSVKGAIDRLHRAEPAKEPSPAAVQARLEAELLARFEADGTAQEWAARKDPDELYRGARLAAAREWAREHVSELNSLDREF